MIESFINFCEQNNINYTLIMTIILISLSLSYYPYFKDKNKFNRLQNYQKMIIVTTLIGTFFSIILLMLDLSKR